MEIEGDESRSRRGRATGRGMPHDRLALRSGAKKEINIHFQGLECGEYSNLNTYNIIFLRRKNHMILIYFA